MRVSPIQIIWRGLTHSCPNCGGRTLFRGLWSTYPTCRQCGMPIEREEGFFVGALAINYGIAVLPIIPILVLVFMGRLDTVPAMVGFGVWAVVAPVVFYRSSKSWWLALYYLIFPRHLPANRPEGRAHMD